MPDLHQLDQSARIDELFRYLTNNRAAMINIAKAQDPAQTEAVQALADRFCVPYAAIVDGVIDTCADAFPVYLLPDFWAPALINGDTSGLSDEDEAALNQWMADYNPGRCIGCSDEVEFTDSHDARDYVLACDCLNFDFEREVSHA
jgi:hypothetical protein